MFYLQNYLKRPDALSMDQAYEIYSQLPFDQAKTDNDFHELWQDVIDAALAYVPIRVNWNEQTHEQRAAIDIKRTSNHNSFIATLSALNRFTMNHYDSANWLAELGDPATNRKRIGDFAGYVVLFGVLQGR